MASKQPSEKPSSLGHAELRLILLLEDLERTVDNAERLANAGLADDAMRLIDLQRDALAQLPTQVAADLATPPRRRFRRVAVVAAAAAFTVAASLASAIGIIGDDETVTAQDVSKKIAAASRMPDPDAGLDTLEDAIIALGDLKADHETVAALSQRAENVARRFYDEHSEGDGSRALEARASELARRARAAVPPSPAYGSSPIDGLLPDA